MSTKRRPTIADVAQAAGVAKSAVSYALNGKPGVSEATRQRILKVADDLEWKPSPAARALMQQRVGLMGLVLNRPARLLSLEPWYMELISGLQEVLGPLDIALALQVVDSRQAEASVYRSWAAKRQVDAVVVTDVSREDNRLDLLRNLGLPAVVLSPPVAASAGQPGFGPGPGQSVTPWLWTDDRAGMSTVLRYLVALGHSRIARVTGLETYAHTMVRTAAMITEAAALGIAEPLLMPTDYTQEAGANATRNLLISPYRPSAIVYDNDLMAATALQVAHELNVAVPGELSVVSWDDSTIARLTSPRLTALRFDIRGYGMRVAQALNLVADGVPVASGASGGVGLEVRGSTGPPPS
ncbi:MAG: LacI family transcriptional regulator [Bifidobacteriaceae bacterium]|jgi:DNA-binding LacI/PurR family transcriptional regulator|nr:LacI family transcriptional regulator [Bifidobacteriaceae bacterium]